MILSGYELLEARIRPKELWFYCNNNIYDESPKLINLAKNKVRLGARSMANASIE
jgi:hypothetical protein